MAAKGLYSSTLSRQIFPSAIVFSPAAAPPLPDASTASLPLLTLPANVFPAESSISSSPEIPPRRLDPSAPLLLVFVGRRSRRAVSSPSASTDGDREVASEVGLRCRARFSRTGREDGQRLDRDWAEPKPCRNSWSAPSLLPTPTVVGAAGSTDAATELTASLRLSLARIAACSGPDS